MEVSGAPPMKPMGYPTLSECWMASAIRTALHDGPMTPAELELRFGVSRQDLSAAVAWMERWGWVSWDGERLISLTSADTPMRGE